MPRQRAGSGWPNLIPNLVAVGVMLFACQTLVGQSVWNLTTDGNWNTAANWLPVGVPNSSSTDVIIDNNSSFNVVVSLNTNAVVSNLTIDLADQLFINNAQRLSVHGTVTNNGLLIVGSTGSNTYFQPVGNITLAGSGILQLNNATGASLYDNSNTNAASDFLTNSAGHTIQGLGHVGFTTNLQITNQGLIHANVSTAVLTVEANAGGLLNTGTLRASGGGILLLDGDQGGLLTNTGALIEAQTGSEVRFNDVQLTGGSITASGTGVLRTLSNSDSFFTNTTINGNMILGSRGDLGLTGTITNTGNILYTDGTATEDTLIDVKTSGATLTGGGSITMVEGSSITGTTAGGTLTIASQTIEGAGRIGRNSIAIANQSGNVIRANVDGEGLSIDPGTAGLVNQGTMEAVEGGRLQLTGNGGGSFNNTGGVIRAANDSEVQFYSGASIVGGVIESIGTGLMRTDGAVNTIFDSLTINGYVLANSRDDITLRGTINNTGVVQINPGNATSDTLLEIEAAGATLTGGGAIFLNGNTSTQFTGAAGAQLTLTNQTIRGGGDVGSGQLLIDNQANGIIHADTTGMTLRVDVAGGAGALTNTGLLQATSGGVLRIDDTFTNDGIINAGALSRVDVNASLTNGVNGRIMGPGELEVSSQLINNGTIAPGNSPGTLTVDLGGTGSLSLGSSSVLEVELASASTIDLLVINGRATLGGELTVKLLGGYVPSNADVYTILTSTNPSGGPPSLGGFSNVVSGLLATEGGEGTFTVSYVSNSQVRLSNFMLVPEPGLAGLAVFVGFTILSGGRRRR